MGNAKRRGWPLFAAVMAAVLLVVAMASRPRKAPPPAPPFHQVTFEADTANYPALSPDGRLIAYCVPRGIGGGREILVQELEGEATARRLADGLWNGYDPVFSPDGAFVYFTSERGPSGIYRVKAAGGVPELVREGAVAGRFSPDGRWFTFNSGAGLAVMPAAGGPARAAAKDVSGSYGAVWSPDSQWILFARRAGEAAPEWWIAPAAGGEAYRTGVDAFLAQQGFNLTEPRVWLPGGDVVFIGRKGETMTLWRIGFPPETRTVTRGPVRATDDAEGDYNASAAAGRIAFERTRVAMNIWSLPVDSAGHVRNAPERLTSTPNQKGGASISRDGRSLLYSEEHEGAYSLVLRDLVSGRQREVRRGTFFSVLRPDGKRFAYASGPMDHPDVLSHSTGWWWFSRGLCTGCGVPRGFSADGESVLVWANSETSDHVDVADVSSGRTRTILSAPPRRSGTARFYAPQLSPDGRAVVFGLRSGEHRFESWIAPLYPDRPTASYEWMPVMPAGETYHIPFWSGDGGLVYILSNHGGGNLKWLEAQPIDGSTLRRSGERFPVYEFHEPRVPMMDPLWNPVMAAAGRIVIELNDMSTNVWVGDIHAPAPAAR